jgi:hypothetical protein
LSRQEQATKLASPISQILVALEKAKIGAKPVINLLRSLHDQEKKYPHEFFDLTGHASLHDLEEYYHEALKAIEAWRIGVVGVLKVLPIHKNDKPDTGPVLLEIQKKLIGYQENLEAFLITLKKSHEAERKRFCRH